MPEYNTAAIKNLTKEDVIPNVPFEKSMVNEDIYLVEKKYLEALVKFYLENTKV